jgi:hypothetical protein
MRHGSEREGDATRTIDLMMVIVLLIAVAGSIGYLSGPSDAEMTTAFIVPSQSVRW